MYVSRIIYGALTIPILNIRYDKCNNSLLTVPVQVCQPLNQELFHICIILCFISHIPHYVIMKIAGKNLPTLLL